MTPAAQFSFGKDLKGVQPVIIVMSAPWRLRFTPGGLRKEEQLRPVELETGVELLYLTQMVPR